MKKKSEKLMILINIILPVLIILGSVGLFLQTYLYNTCDRVCDLSRAVRDGTRFQFEHLTVEIVTRGGDTGAWHFGGHFDDEENCLINTGVGAIYDMAVINNTSDTLLDWTITLRVPEDMYINNSWNGSFELHQNVKSGNEKVQTIYLNDFSKYDISLEGYTANVGPMIKLYEGDYFVYHPDVEKDEASIAPKQENSPGGGVRFGFIMYIENRDVNYIADFSAGEVHYHLKTKVVKNPLFWVLLSLTVIWIACLAAAIAAHISVKRVLEQRRRDEKALEQTMQTFVNFIEAKDPDTSGHSLRVAQYSKMLAEKLGFDEEECKRIYRIALMHDCGKIYVPDEILTKPGRLTDEEFEAMKKHTLYGAEMLKDFTAIEGMGTGALTHHERYDGKGYPHGISGEDIPVIGRIIGVSDAFDAMNSHRCYRKSLTKEVILSELTSNKGKQFDPLIADCLLELIDSGKITFSNSGSEK